MRCSCARRRRRLRRLRSRGIICVCFRGVGGTGGVADAAWRLLIRRHPNLMGALPQGVPRSRCAHPLHDGGGYWRVEARQPLHHQGPLLCLGGRGGMGVLIRRRSLCCGGSGLRFGRLGPACQSCVLVWGALARRRFRHGLLGGRTQGGLPARAVRASAACGAPKPAHLQLLPPHRLRHAARRHRQGEGRHDVAGQQPDRPQHPLPAGRAARGDRQPHAARDAALPRFVAAVAGWGPAGSAVQAVWQRSGPWGPCAAVQRRRTAFCARCSPLGARTDCSAAAQKERRRRRRRREPRGARSPVQREALGVLPPDERQQPRDPEAEAPSDGAAAVDDQEE